MESELWISGKTRLGVYKALGLVSSSSKVKPYNKRKLVDTFKTLPGLTEYTTNPSNWEVKTGGSKGQYHLLLHSELEHNPSYTSQKN